MNIATIIINKYLTSEEQLNIVSNGGDLTITIMDSQTGEQVDLNIADKLAIGEGLYFVQTFKDVDYQLNKNNTTVKIINDNDNFKLKASKLIDIEGNNEELLSHIINLKISVNNGDINNPITSIVENVDIYSTISQEQVDKFNNLGLTLLGEFWKDFSVTGKSKIEFLKMNDSTIFIGNNDNGFITN